MIDKSESVNWPNVCWILGADHLTFGGLWVISEKISYRLITRGKMHANKFLGEKYPALKKISLMTYNAEKKILHRYVKSVKSPIPHSPTNVQWSCQPFISGWGTKKRINLTPLYVNVIHQRNGWRAITMRLFSRLKFEIAFQDWKYADKDTSGKRKFKIMLCFLSVDKRKLFAMKLSFDEFNLVSSLSTRWIGALGLFWANRSSEVS